MSDTKLKPCPKCGSTSLSFTYDHGYSVFCRSCNYEVYPCKLEKFAAEVWNSLPRTQGKSEPLTEPEILV